MLLTQWFDPEPTFKGLVFASELVKQGFEVEVLTGFPNYPSGKLYPGYKLKWLQRETVDNVQISRVPLYPNHDQSAFKRIINYASFGASALFYGLFVAKRPDVIYAYHPPLSVGLTACLIRLIRGIPVIYDVQDMWPDTLRATGMLNNSRALGLVSSVCNWVYRQVNHVVVLSPGFKKILLDRGVPESKISVVYNWADEKSLSTPSGQIDESFPDSSWFRILFAGNMGKAQSLQTVLEAAELLQAQESRVCWVMLGGGIEVDNLKVEAKRRNLRNVIFLPAVPMSEVGNYLQSADVMLVHLRRDPLFEITIPSKTQAYMSVGKPQIMAVTGDAASLVNQSGGGVTLEPEDAHALAAVADQLANTSAVELKEMGQRAQNFYQMHLSLSIGAKRFGELFQQFANVKK